jgi:co-chaperonin GroES (HSP10)
MENENIKISVSSFLYSDNSAELFASIESALENGDVKPLDVKVGDLLIFNKNSGTSIKEGPTEYRIVSIRDVIGTIIV